MPRTPVMPTPAGTALQIAGLLLVAAAVFAVLIADIVSTRSGPPGADGVTAGAPARGHDAASTAHASGPR